MRILSVLPNLRMGGAQRIALDLAKGFDAAGDISIVCAAGSNGEFRDEVGEVAFEAFKLRLSPATLLPFVVFLLRNIRRYRPDVLLVHLLPLNLLLLALVAIRLIRAPIVVVEHSHRSAFEELGGSSRLRRRVTYLLVRLLYPYAGAVVGVSRAVSRDIASRMRTGANVHTIANGVDVGLINRRCREQTEESKRIAALSSPALVGVGRLTRPKAFEDLVSALALVRLQPGFETASLSILGEGPERARLEGLAKEFGLESAVWLPGAVANPWAVMASADLFVLSSRWEGFGLVVAEAVCLGLPVVSTDCLSGPADILAGNPRAQLVPVGNPAAIAEAICATLQTADSVEPVPLRAEYSIDTTARRYRQLFARLTGR